MEITQEDMKPNLKPWKQYLANTEDYNYRYFAITRVPKIVNVIPEEMIKNQLLPALKEVEQSFQYDDEIQQMIRNWDMTFKRQ